MLFRKLRRRLRGWLAPDSVDAEIDREIRFHLEMRAAEYRAKGLSPGDAVKAAEKRFGKVELVRRECRRLSRVRPSRKGDASVSVLMADIRVAFRSLVKSPGFTAVVVSTLALGIGANTAMFSVVEGVLLRPLPFAASDQLVMLWQNDRLRGTTQENFSIPDFFDVRDRNEVLQGLALLWTPSLTLTEARQDPLLVSGARVSKTYFEVLGVAPALGRSFLPEEREPGGNPVAILSHGLFMSRFGGDPTVIGRRIELEGVSTEIVGVMAPEFRFPSRTDVWLPAQITETSGSRGNHGVLVVGRRRDGVSLERVNANLEAIATSLEVEYRDDNEGRGMWAESMTDAMVASVRPSLLLLQGAVLLVLLIACVNVANLLVARALSREQEAAIRSAMGAARSVLVRQYLVEALLLSLSGGLLGLFLAYRGMDLLLASLPPSLPRAFNVGVNGNVLLFSLVLSVATGVFFGLAPALRLSRGNLVASLREGERSGESSARQRARAVLVTLEIAGAVVLVVCAGLLIESFRTLLRVDPGFVAANVVSVDIQLPEIRYPQDRDSWPRWTEVRQFQKALLEQARSTPGIDSAALAINGPLDPGWTSRFVIEGRPDVAPGQQDEVRVRVVSPDYFRTLGIPILRGRSLDPGDDRDDSPPVIVVNEAFVRRYFVDEEPLGARLSQWGLTREIVGVVRDVRFQGLQEEAQPAIYPTFSQAPFTGFSLLVHTREEPEAVFARLRAITASLDRDLALSGFTTLERRLAASVSERRFTMNLFGAFAGLALLLSTLGIYGVMSFSVGRRQHEFGVRMSLGAARHDVLRLVLTDGSRLALLGIGLGLLVAVFVTRFLQSLLYGVSRFDPVTFLVVSLLAATVTILACTFPALRATRVDPLVALRHE
ncbi:MAG TPA: ABC transporter permease [Vicinamibacteria bacterium]|nr:ABC transporter permease [Vicinamibacteria bacterium]